MSSVKLPFRQNDLDASRWYVANMATEIRRGARLHAYVSEHLKSKGWTQERLAGLMEVHPSTITGYKQDNWDIAPSLLAQIADLLGLDDPLDIFKPPAAPPAPKPPRRKAADQSELEALKAEVAKLARIVGQRK